MPAQPRYPAAAPYLALAPLAVPPHLTALPLRRHRCRPEAPWKRSGSPDSTADVELCMAGAAQICSSPAFLCTSLFAPCRRHVWCRGRQAYLLSAGRARLLAGFVAVPSIFYQMVESTPASNGGASVFCNSPLVSGQPFLQLGNTRLITTPRPPPSMIDVHHVGPHSIDILIMSETPPHFSRP